MGKANYPMLDFACAQRITERKEKIAKLAKETKTIRDASEAYRKKESFLTKVGAGTMSTSAGVALLTTLPVITCVLPILIPCAVVGLGALGQIVYGKHCGKKRGDLQKDEKEIIQKLAGELIEHAKDVETTNRNSRIFDSERVYDSILDSIEAAPSIPRNFQEGNPRNLQLQEQNEMENLLNKKVRYSLDLALLYHARLESEKAGKIIEEKLLKLIPNFVEDQKQLISKVEDYVTNGAGNKRRARLSEYLSELLPNLDENQKQLILDMAQERQEQLILDVAQKQLIRDAASKL